MEEKELKTSVGQRVVIIAIAVIMLGSIIASYAAIVANGGKAPTDTGEQTSLSDEKIAEYQKAYNEKLADFQKVTKNDYDKFIQYRSEVKAYNETTANSDGLKYRDLKVGNGRELKEGDTDYLSYYIGWCADEKIFDSSLDDVENPTGFSKALNASLGMIEGWNQGVIGMRLGGVRKITIPGELAYKDQMEICGGYNKPLKFIVMAVANEGDLAKTAEALDTAFMKLQYANYGIDYDAMMNQQ